MNLTEKMIEAAKEKSRYMGIDEKKYKEASEKYYCLLDEWRKQKVYCRNKNGGDVI